jgi:hypothetical protein
MTIEELHALSAAAWKEAGRLAEISDTCPLEDRPQAVKDWEAAFRKAAEASRRYNAAWKAQP